MSDGVLRNGPPGRWELHSAKEEDEMDLASEEGPLEGRAHAACRGRIPCLPAGGRVLLPRVYIAELSKDQSSALRDES